MFLFCKHRFDFCKDALRDTADFCSINRKMMELSQNTILITEGTGGLGFGFAYKLIELGNKVIITGSNTQRLERAKKLLPALQIITLDITRTEHIASLYERVIDEFPTLNVLINNSGDMPQLVFHGSRILYDITREIEINMTGPVCMVQQFLPHLKTQESAAILNVTSGIALVPYPVAPGQSANRTELRSYTQSLREELKHTRIKVFELAAPGSFNPAHVPFTQVDSSMPNEFQAPDNIIEHAIRRLREDTYDIDPTLANLLRIRSRLASDSCFNN